MTAPRFLIVTPTFQSEAYLNACIHSIVGQSGVHEVHYHVQDGGSSDGTLELVRRWQALLEVSNSVFSCRVTLTYDSAPDRGMYDAVARGFRHLRPRPGDIMAWLNSDDLFAPGAFTAVAGAMQAFPEIQLCGGPSGLIDARGQIVQVGDARPIPSLLLRAGLCDGRSQPFVMQEGTFWTPELWEQSGGLNTRFRLVGDWDLWRRMAELADYVRLNVSTGFHRRRPGQLSQDMDAYYQELDGSLDATQALERDRALGAYLTALAGPSTRPLEAYDGPVAHWDREIGRWALGRQGPRVLPPPRETTPLGRRAFQRMVATEGAAGFEQADPGRGVPFGARWLSDPVARLEFDSARVGCRRVTLICRPFAPDVRLTVRSEGEVVFAGAMSIQAEDQDQRIEFDLWTGFGRTSLSVETAFAHRQPDQRLLLLDAYVSDVQSPSERRPAAPRATQMGIAVIHEGESQGLGRTLGALAAQSIRSDLQVTVFTRSTDPTFDAIRDAFAPDAVCVVDDPATACMAHLEAGPGALKLVISSGTTLAPNAAEDVVQAHAAQGAAAYVGWSAGQDWTGRARVLLAGHAADREPLVLSAEAWRTVGRDGSAWDPVQVRRCLLDQGLPVRVLDHCLAREVMPSDPEVPLRLAWICAAATTGAVGTQALLSRMDTHVRTWRVGEALSLDAAMRQVRAWSPDFLLLSDDLVSPADMADVPPDVCCVPEAWRAEAQALADRAYLTEGDIQCLATAGLDALLQSSALTSTGVADNLRALVMGQGRLLDDRLSRLSEVSDGSIRLIGADGKVVDASGPAADQGLTIEASKTIYLAVPPSAVARSIWIEVEWDDTGEVSLGDSDWRVELSEPGEHLVEIPATGMPGLRRIALTLRPDHAETEPLSVRVRLAASERQATGDAFGQADWSPLNGFGPERAGSVSADIEGPFRWILGSQARLVLENRKRGWCRLTLRLRTEARGQRLMVVHAGRILTEAAVTATDLSQPIEVTILADLPAGPVELDLNFQSLSVPADGTAILEAVSLEASRAPRAGSDGRWQIVAGGDFEEPAAPQFGLDHPFRWCLQGCVVWVQPSRPGLSRVTLRYRTAFAGQVVQASLDGVELAQSEAAAGDLRRIEVFSFLVDLPAAGADVALAADVMASSGRHLAFIIEALAVAAADQG